jgi:ribonuclease P protein component
MEAAMLDRAHRLRRRTDFAAAIRRGRRVGRRTLVVHLHRVEPGRPVPGRPAATETSAGADFEGADRLGGGRPSTDPTSCGRPGDAGPGGLPRAGFIVPRAVGGAVVRNTIRRRLRHLVRAHLADLPAGSMLVIRALPAAAGAGSARLGADLTAALHAAARHPHSTAAARAGARVREPAP